MLCVCFQTEEECIQKDPLNELIEDTKSIDDTEQKKSNENEYICTAMEYTEVPEIINNITAINADSDANENLSDEFEVTKVEPVSFL